MAKDHASVKRKRGRKAIDEVDHHIKDTRRTLLRGIPFIIDRTPNIFKEPDLSLDEVARSVINRELDLIRNRDLVEIRQVCNIDQSSGWPTTTVATRLSIPVLASSRCINNAMSYLQHFEFEESGQESPAAFFTPEAYILLSKTCEQLIVELASRSFMNAVLSGGGRLLDAPHLADAVRSTWKSREREYSAAGAFDFLIDTLDRFDDFSLTDPIDKIGKIHRTT